MRLCSTYLLAGFVVWWAVAALGQGKRAATARELFYTAPPAASDDSKPVSGELPAPLGLRYSVLERNGDQMIEVDPGTVFRSGDRIRLGVEVNNSGYLYVVNQGSSGNWRILFPSPEVAGGDNTVERGRRYEVPSGYTFTFDEQRGVERLFIVFSRRPQSDLDELIYSLRRAPAQDSAREQEGSPKRTLDPNPMKVDNGVVDRIRRASSRDLIIEKVDDQTPGSRNENATYAVNPAGGTDARVVADVSLTHQ